MSMLPFRQAVLIIAVVAVCTFLTRLAPFLLFGRGGKTVPPAVQYLGRVLPAAIMATLIVYCLKSVSLFAAPHGLPELIAVAATALLHLWRHNVLLSVGAGTVLYMVLIQCVFI